MSNFTLLEYTTEKSKSALGKVNFLKKNCSSFKNAHIKPYLVAFENGLDKIKRDYIIEMKKIYKEDETFHFLVPVSSCDYFVNKIKDWITDEFPFAIDISEFFSESEKIDVARLGINAEESLKQNLVISESLNEHNISKIFIGDDVYNTGTSIEVYKELIKEKLNDKIEFSHGTLIKIQ